MRAILFLLLAGSAFAGEPPTLTLPPKVEGGSFAVLAAVTDGKAVEYVPLDKGLEFFPNTLLRDPKVAVVFGPKGSYRVMAYTGNADGPSKPAYTVVVLGGGTEPPPDPPKPDPPTPGPKAAKLYLAVIHDPMNVSTDTAILIGDTPFWDGLKKDGHEWDVWPNTSQRAKELNYLKLVEGVALPALLVLDKETGRKLSAVKLPKDKAAVSELLKGVAK